MQLTSAVAHSFIIFVAWRPEGFRRSLSSQANSSRTSTWTFRVAKVRWTHIQIGYFKGVRPRVVQNIWINKRIPRPLLHGVLGSSSVYSSAHTPYVGRGIDQDEIARSSFLRPRKTLCKISDMTRPTNGFNRNCLRYVWFMAYTRTNNTRPSICARMFPYTANLFGIPVHELILRFAFCICSFFHEVRRAFYFLSFSDGSNIFSSKSISLKCFRVGYERISHEQVKVNTDKLRNPEINTACYLLTVARSGIQSDCIYGLMWQLWCLRTLGWGPGGEGARRAQ